MKLTLVLRLSFNQALDRYQDKEVGGRHFEAHLTKFIKKGVLGPNHVHRVSVRNDWGLADSINSPRQDRWLITSIKHGARVSLNAQAALTHPERGESLIAPRSENFNESRYGVV